tara:strand:- start:5533 stop:7023 length:1491 start_codon:yes stop_codon:yes gene_type:complete
MFKFLKEKIKGAVSKIKDKVEQEPVVEEEVEVEKEEVSKDFSDIKKELEYGEEKEEIKEEGKFEEEKEEEKEEIKEEEEKEKEIQKEEEKEELKEEGENEKVQEETEEEVKEKEIDSAPKVEVYTEKPKKGFFTKLKEKISEKKEKDNLEKEEELKEKVKEALEKAEEKKKEELKEKSRIQEEKRKESLEKGDEKSDEDPEEKKGIFKKFTQTISTTKLNQEKFDDIFWELELALMENNVAVEVITKIKEDLGIRLVEVPIKRNDVEGTILNCLKDSITGLFQSESLNILKMIEDKPEKPYVIVFFGINGSGKTTSIAKFAKLLMDQGKSVVLAAADTFRAASIEQLQHHGEKLGAKVIKHDYGSDPAAVAFDAVKHAKSQNTDVVLIDTAGRMHSNKNLVDEMKKIVRVSDPDLKIFVGESITGNDCVEQAKTFNEAVGIDGIILSKVDIDEKGGAAVSVGYVTKKPIVYIGVGQEYKDLKEFDSKVVVENLGLA